MIYGVSIWLCDDSKLVILIHSALLWNQVKIAGIPSCLAFTSIFPPWGLLLPPSHLASTPDLWLNTNNIIILFVPFIAAAVSSFSVPRGSVLPDRMPTYFWVLTIPNLHISDLKICTLSCSSQSVLLFYSSSNILACNSLYYLLLKISFSVGSMTFRGVLAKVGLSTFAYYYLAMLPYFLLNSFKLRFRPE